MNRAVLSVFLRTKPFEYVTSVNGPLTIRETLPPSSVFSCTPLTGPRLTLRSVSPSNCLEEVIELATLNPLCYPNSYLSELQPEAAVPDFH